MAIDLNLYNKPRFTALQWRTFIIVATLAALLVMNATRSRPYIHPQFIADPYIAPQGCVVRSYERSDGIAESCVDRRYIFTKWRDYGLQYPGKGGAYYRIGNDLIGINCNYSTCHVHGSTERNVFLDAISSHSQ